MKEGWFEETYWVAYDETESKSMTSGYGISRLLPGHTVVALVGWDDFIVRDEVGRLFRVPTVPLSAKYVEPFRPLPDLDELTSDERYAGKIKWYVQSIAFGGSPNAEENMTWVDVTNHQELVWW